mgnify:CR=1 FL=1
MGIREYIRLGRIDIYIKSLFIKYKFAQQKHTLKIMKDNLKKLKGGE